MDLRANLLMDYRYERIAWFPVLVTFIISLGLGGKWHLSNIPPAEPATAPAVLNSVATLAGFAITYCPLSSDFTYYSHEVSYFPSCVIPILRLIKLGSRPSKGDDSMFRYGGRRLVLALPSVPDWQEGSAGGNVGGLLEAMLSSSRQLWQIPDGVAQPISGPEHSCNFLLRQSEHADFSSFPCRSPVCLLDRRDGNVRVHFSD